MNQDIKLRTFRHGDAPKRGEGLRIGTTRRPPRGVTKDHWGDYFDVWFPILAPSAALLQRSKRSQTMDYHGFCASYERELLGSAESRQALDLLAALALRIPISIGCYCEDESRCHRTHLRKLIEREARKLSPRQTPTNAMTEFSDKLQPDAHSQFQAWRRANPDGYFLNPKSPKDSYLLHRVPCPHLGNDTWMPEDFDGATLTRKHKLCSTDPKELQDLAAERGFDLRDCNDCM